MISSTKYFNTLNTSLIAIGDRLWRIRNNGISNIDESIKYLQEIEKQCVEAKRALVYFKNTKDK